MRRDVLDNPRWNMILALAALAALTATPTLAQDHPTPNPPLSAPPTIDPTLPMLAGILEHHGPQVSLFSHDPPGRARGCLLVELVGEPSRALRVYWASVGIELVDELDVGEKRYAQIMAPWSVLLTGDGLQGVRRAEACWVPRRLATLEITGASIGAARAHIDPDLGFTGRGVTIADIDSGVDVLHPALFHADGGHFAWVDMDGDGAFRAGRDGVDFDGDGQVEQNEVLRALFATDVQDATVVNEAEQIRPERDWLFLDRNQDRVRNVGAEGGFLESDPGYGEPLFVIDDVDRDGVLDLHEKLVLLSTSKVARYMTDGRVYERGLDLIESTSAPGHERAFHGTGVAGILVGGHPGYHARVGVAPEADLVMMGISKLERSPDSDGDDDDEPLGMIREAVAQRARVLLHEWSNPFTRPLDGSTLLEDLMVSVAEDEGILHVIPSGNLHGSHKHAEHLFEVEGENTLSISVSAIEEGGQLVQPAAMFGSLQWRGDRALSVRITLPSMESLELVKAGERVAMLHQSGQMILSTTLEETSAGTHFFRFYIFTSREDIPLEEGAWTLSFDGGSQGQRILARVGDYVTTWSGGIGFDRAVDDQRYTLSFPASAPVGLRVGAVGGRFASEDDGTGAGELRGYSGRGPTFDERQVLGLVAPDDPFSALAVTEALAERGVEQGYFRNFGGTSGAGAHAAGAAALLIEQDSARSPEATSALLRASARRDAIAGISEWPDAGWGDGVLDVRMALGGERAGGEDESLPSASLEVKPDEERGVLVFDVTSDAPGAMARFDFDYDGEFDTAWRAELSATRAIDALEPGEEYLARAQVRDRDGRSRGAIVAYSLGGEVGELDMGSMGEGGMSESGGARMRCLCGSAPGGEAPSRAPLFGVLWVMCAWRVRRRWT